MLFKNIVLSLKKSRTSVLLNVLGLSVAFAVFSVVLMQVRYEFGFNKSLENYDRISVLQMHNKVDGSTAPYVSTLASEAIGSQIPEISSFCYLASWYYGSGQSVYTKENGSDARHYFKAGLFGASRGFFDVFKPTIVEGDTKRVFVEDNVVMIPQSLAKRMFGNSSPINRMLYTCKGDAYTIAAVYKDLKKNTSIPNEIYVKCNLPVDNNNWNVICYVVAKNDPSDLSDINAKLKKVFIGGQSLEKIASDEKYSFSFLPLKDLYFSGIKENEAASELGSKPIAYTLLAIGILILLIAFINFVNFATALAPSRIKGINTYRVMGASRRSLQLAILCESALLAFGSFLLSIVWIKLLVLTPAADFFEAILLPSANLGLLTLVGIGSIVLGALAGVYPALYMTSFNPALVLKGTFALSPKGAFLRNSLLIFQFAISILLIVVAISVGRQNYFLRNYSVGFDRENIVYLNIPAEMKGHQDSFIQELKSNPSIKETTCSGALPGYVEMGWGREIEGQSVQFSAWPVDENFLKFFNIKLLEGTTFLNHHDSTVNKVVVNKAFVDKFKIKKIVGKRVLCFANMGDICGVASNINFNSLKSKVEPMAFICGSDQRTSNILIKIAGSNVPSTIQFINSKIKEYCKEPTEVAFLDDNLNKLYQKEANLSSAITLFCIATILISLLGVYGLVVFNAKYKTKEIAIRKVNGATVFEVVYLLSRSLIRMVVVAFVLSTPIAYWIVSRWLEGFAYHTRVEWWTFAAAGFVTFVVTAIAVFGQTRKAALSNPVLSLKNE